MYILQTKSNLSAYFGFIIAISAINRLITARFKGYFGILAAISTCYGKHLAWAPIAMFTIAITL